jgi:hypothetical protein
MDDLDAVKQQIERESERSTDLELKIISILKQILAEKSRIFEIKQLNHVIPGGQSNLSLGQLEGLSSEYLDILRDKQDALAALGQALRDTEFQIAQLDADTDSLFEFHTNTLVNLHRANMAVLQEEFANVPAKMEKAFAASSLRDLNIMIREAETLRAKTENTLSTMLIHTEKHEYEGGGVVDLQNSIANLRAEIDVIDSAMSEDLIKLANHNEAEKTEQEKQDAELGKVHRMYDWGKQKSQMEGHLADTKRAISQNQAQVAKYDRLVLLKEKRLKILQPLVPKHFGKVGTVDLPPDSDIDGLISTLERVSKASQTRSKQNDRDLSALIVQNNETAQIIEERLREIHQLTTLTSSECASLRREITSARSRAADREASLVKSLRELKVKSVSRSKPRPKPKH